jgi:hypothetical protein
MSRGVRHHLLTRVRAGYLTAEQMWLELVRDMPQGLPQAGDRGLDHTHTWARTYWGGPLFCLLADVEIRRQTINAKGLERALRGILDAGGDIRSEWNLENVLRAGDRAVGVSVLQRLYAKMKDKPVSVDLAALWAQLGVQSAGTNGRSNCCLRPEKSLCVTQPGAESGRATSGTSSRLLAT